MVREGFQNIFLRRNYGVYLIVYRNDQNATRSAGFIVGETHTFARDREPAQVLEKQLGPTSNLLSLPWNSKDFDKMLAHIIPQMADVRRLVRQPDEYRAFPRPGEWAKLFRISAFPRQADSLHFA